MIKTNKTERYFDKVVEDAEVKKIKIKPKKIEGNFIKVKDEKKPKNLGKFQKKGKHMDKFKANPKLIAKHSRGENIQNSGVKTNFFKEKIKRKEVVLNYATEQAARTEILRNEDVGFLEADEEERTCDYRQTEIAKNLDLISSSKLFNLELDFGPYKHKYTKNGRHLLIGGKRGHVAAFDWISKKLNCEINVMEEIADISWLHVETMFAVAQKKWVYFYDNQGTEIHCVKRLYDVNVMEFLPYHFLLATGSGQGYLSWLDISIGELVGHYNTKMDDIQIMRQNPSNGVICVGGGKGVVSMWSPKVKEPLAKLLTHSTPITSLAINSHSHQLVTSGLDNIVKIWDVRELKGPLASYRMEQAINAIDISQKGIMALTKGNICEIYNNTIFEEKPRMYLRHKTNNMIESIKFCPYEDILGISTYSGFNSILVPGSGEPNFDAYEANPFETKLQRKEREVHSLLEKIPPEFITLDSSAISGVDKEKLQDIVDYKKQLFYLKPPKIDFTSRRKMKGKGGSVKASRNKQIVKNLKRKEFIQNVREEKKKVIKETQIVDGTDRKVKKPSVLDRFQSKKRINPN